MSINTFNYICIFIHSLAWLAAELQGSSYKQSHFLSKIFESFLNEYIYIYIDILSLYSWHFKHFHGNLGAPMILGFCYLKVYSNTFFFFFLLLI